MPYHIYTRTGDAGQTGLFGGERVPKNCLRVEAYGAVDELNAVVGVARACGPNADHDSVLALIQGSLFEVGADLATPETTASVHGGVSVRRVSEFDTVAIERQIDRFEETLPALQRFVLPGGCALAAQLHVARTVCRRAERRCLALANEERVNAEIVRYLNRLSDLLFVMARAANRHAGVDDVEWSSPMDSV